MEKFKQALKKDEKTDFAEYKETFREKVNIEKLAKKLRALAMIGLISSLTSLSGCGIVDYFLAQRCKGPRVDVLYTATVREDQLMASGTPYLKMFQNFHANPTVSIGIRYDYNKRDYVYSPALDHYEIQLYNVVLTAKSEDMRRVCTVHRISETEFHDDQITYSMIIPGNVIADVVNREIIPDLRNDFYNDFTIYPKNGMLQSKSVRIDYADSVITRIYTTMIDNGDTYIINAGASGKHVFYKYSPTTGQDVTKFRLRLTNKDSKLRRVNFVIEFPGAMEYLSCYRRYSSPCVTGDGSLTILPYYRDSEVYVTAGPSSEAFY